MLAECVFWNRPHHSEYLIEKGADVNGTINGEPYLTFCVRNNQILIASYLIKHGADVNGTVDGVPYLTFCIRNGYNHIPLLLVEHDAAHNRPHRPAMTVDDALTYIETFFSTANASDAVRVMARLESISRRLVQQETSE